jgi:pyridoxine 5-phosphate synthase
MELRPRLSVNVNKVATVRNARGGQEPDPARAARVAIQAGAPGITVHPREDQRHITPDDVRACARVVSALREAGRRELELNVEGDPRPDLLALVHEVRPDQLTLVPVRPGEVTSEAGWPEDTPREALARTIRDAQAAGIRVSLFVEARASAVRWAQGMGADRVELYTEPYARACAAGQGDAAYAPFAEAAELAHELGLGVNAGHDLDLTNLPRFRGLPHLDEVSIGHALVSHALFVGLAVAVRDYLDCLAG